ncbi:MAG TPA: autotransporter-associated beta strand repeat-containing protein, partial [Gammaproteobacteria bacterium]|nr:autotransporter-associated beta strand repeat-containing protein [Gammaproteobacteria bacterium]
MTNTPSMTKRYARHLRMIAAWSISFLFTCGAYSNPILDNVASGNVTVQQTGTTTTVNQTSQKAILNWNSFNIGGNETTHFQQPTGGVALNRINPNQGASQIYGRLTATGQIILMNSAGIYFAPGAYVNVGGLIATTGNISDQDFLNNYYHFQNSNLFNGSIINEGTIIAADHGLIALAGGSVQNNGLIQANLGQVALGSGNAFTLSFDNSGLINFAVDAPTTQRAVDQNGNELRDGIKNTGSIIADGGSILMTARSAQGVLDNAINMEGIVQARSVQSVNGEIILSGDMDGGIDENTGLGSGLVRVAGKLDVSGKNTGEKGGKLQITGQYLLLDNNALIDASGDIGGGNINIGGSFQGVGPLPNSVGNVTLEGANIYADALTSGNGGEIVLWADYLTRFYGNIFSRGGAVSGDGGQVEVSGKDTLDFNGFVNTLATNGVTGHLLLDPAFINVITGGATAYSGNNLFANNLNGTSNFSPANLIAAATNITLQAVTDVTFTNALTLTGTNTLTVQAGRDIIINANIATNNAAITMTANDSTAGSTSSRAAGTGDIVMGAGTSINSGTAALSLTIDPSTATSGSNTYSPGNMTLINLTGGAISLTGTSASSSVTATGNIATSTSLTINMGGGSNFNTGVISGAGSIIKQGSSTLDISGANTYSGGTTINGGIVLLGSATGLGSGTLTLGSNTLRPTTTATIANAISCTGCTLSALFSGFTLSGLISGTSMTVTGGSSATINITNTGNTYNGGTNMNLGTINNTLAFAGGTAAGSGAITLTSGTLAATSGGVTIGNAITASGGSIGGSNDFTLSGVVSGSGTLNKTGSNTITLSGNSNAYTGIIAINAGTISAAHANALGTSAGSTQIFSGATLDINNVSITTGEPLQFASNPIITGTGTASLSSNINLIIGGSGLSIGGTGTLTLSGVLSGSAGFGFTKIGAGTLILSNTNTYQGSTNINAGSVSVSADGNLGTAPGSPTANIIFNGGSLITTADMTLDVNRSISMTGTGSFAPATSTTLTIPGVISGTGVLTMLGAGTLSLTGANTFSGGLTISSGTLSAGTNTALGSGVTNLSGTLVTSTGGLTLANDIYFGGGGTIGGSNDFTLSGNISSGDVTKSGSNTVTLSNSGNSYDGNTFINAGTLSVASDGALGTNFGVGNMTLNGGTLRATGSFTLNSARGISLNSGSSSISVDPTFTLTYGGVIAGAGDFVKAGTGTLSLGGANTYTGATTLSGGTLSFTANQSLPGAFYFADSTTLTTNNNSVSIGPIVAGGGTSAVINTGTSGTLTINQSTGGYYTGLFTGSGNIVKNGASLLEKYADNSTFTGTLSINNGTLQVYNAAAIGTGAATVNIASGAQLLVWYNTINNLINLNGGTLALSQDAGSSGNITLGANSFITGGIGYLSSNISGGFGLTYSNSTLYINSNSTYSGGSTITSGEQVVYTPTSLGTGAITLNGGHLEIGFSSQTMANNIAIGASGGGIRNGMSGASDATLSGVISGSGALSMWGSNNLNLSGNNTYSGTMTIGGPQITVLHNNALGA